jgi:phospholipid-translocating ATPase
MSFFKRRSVVDEPNSDDEHDDTIDPELRLRTVRTAASAIEESIKSEQRAERRKSMRKTRSRFNFTTRSRQERKLQEAAAGGSTSAPAPSTTTQGSRRNVYVNQPLSAMEADHDGEPKITYARNKVRTTSAYTVRFVACLY